MHVDILKIPECCRTMLCHLTVTLQSQSPKKQQTTTPDNTEPISRPKKYSTNKVSSNLPLQRFASRLPVVLSCNFLVLVVGFGGSGFGVSMLSWITDPVSKS